MKAYCVRHRGEIEVWANQGDWAAYGPWGLERTRCPECGGLAYIGWSRLPWLVRIGSIAIYRWTLSRGALKYSARMTWLRLIIVYGKLRRLLGLR